MSVDIDSLLVWGRRSFVLIGWLAFLLGAFSLIAPGRSIALYQWIMERLNWRVSPINEKREMINTRLLGFGLVVLSLMLFRFLQCVPEAAQIVITSHRGK